MAQDNAAQAIRDLAKNLEQADMRVKALSGDIQEYFNRLTVAITSAAQKSNVSIDQMFEYIARKKGAVSAEKIRLQFDAAKTMADIDSLESAIKSKMKTVTLFSGEEITGIDKMRTRLGYLKTEFEKIAAEAKMTVPQMTEAMINMVNGSIGHRKSYSPLTRQRVEDEKKIQKIQEDITLTLQRRKELEKQMEKYSPDSKSKKLRAMRAEWEQVNKQAQEYISKLGSLGTAGSRALKGFETAGLLTTADKAQLEAERNYIKLLRERQQLEEKSLRLSYQLQNAKASGKASPDFINQTQGQLDKNAERIGALEQKLQSERVQLTAEGQRRVEEMALAHQNRLTNITNQGEQARRRIEERKNNAQAEKELAAFDAEIKNRQDIAKQRAKEKLAIEQKQAEALKRQIQIQDELIAKTRQIAKEQAAINIELKRAKAEGRTAIITKEQNAISSLRKDMKGLREEAENIDKEFKGTLETAEKLKKSKWAYTAAKDARMLRNSLREINKTAFDIIPILRRIGYSFGIYFSARGLVQFAKKLVETRGEFEMQFVAMKQIIGDVDAATKIWNETMQQALQSPFKAMQLVTYTKQLAAYRIETEKLFDTTKRLADVSAGLGVDMGRLILAYGQVKAANYLRASEVRQFTEAGVNIAGNLAKYFTELEGRAVGTAEVMQRITKRMVLFSDVEAIFKRMTDEGGEFFNMQEIQADTVKGQVMKLKDAYDQMLNAIGESKQGTIRKWIDRLNDLIRNWQNLAFILKANINWITAVGVALYYLSSKYLQSATSQTLWFSKALTGNAGVLLKEAGAVRLFGNEVGILTMKQRMGVIAMRTFQGAISALGSVLRRFWPLIVFEGIVWFIEKITKARRELKRLREDMQAVASDNVERMKEEINGYGSLIEKLKQTTEGTMARKEVLDEISRRYGKYLDFIVTEKTSIEELAGAYDKVVGSIRNYTAEKIREEQQQKVEKGMYDAYQDLVGSLTGSKFWDSEGGLTHKITKTQAQNIAKIVQKSLEDYGTANIQEILSKYFGESYQYAFATGGANQDIINKISSFVSQWKGLKGELNDIRDEIEGETPVFATEAEYEAYKKNVKETEEELRMQNELYEERVKKVKEETREKEEQWKLDDKLEQLRVENEEDILRIKKEHGLLTEEQYKNELNRLHGVLDVYEEDYNKRLANALASKFGATWKTSSKEARDMYNYVVSTEDALQQGTEQRNKSLKESYKSFKDSLEQYEVQLAAAQKTDASKEAIDNINKSIDWVKLMISAIELAAQLRGIDLSEKKKTTRTTHENASKLISLIKEMRSEYDKLSKSAYGYAKSEEKVRESYAQSVEKILGKAGVTKDYDFTTNEGMIAALNKVLVYANKLGKEAAAEVQKYIDQLETEAEINIQVKKREDFAKQMEKMFNDYELTIELKKFSLPSDELAGIFDFDLTTLEELREAVDDIFYDQAARDALSEDSLKQIKDFRKKIDEMERKSLLDRLKKYTEYLTKGRDEAVQIHLEELKAMAEIDELYERGAFTDEQYDTITKAVRKETDEKLAKQVWKDFKESDYYTTMFQDIEHVATSSIDLMIERLKGLQKSMSNLDPTQVKEIVQSIEKLEKQKRERSPLRSFFEDIKTWNSWSKKRDKNDKWLNFLTQGEGYWLTEKAKKAKEVAQLEQEYNKLALDGEQENAAAAKERWEFAKTELDDINERLEKYGLKISEINEENNEGYAAMRRTLQGVAQGAQYFSDMASTAGTIATEMMDMFDGVDDASKKLAKDIADIATNSAMLAADIAKAIASEGTDVGSMIDGLVRTWNIIKGSLSASEAEINRIIEKQTDLLEDLEWKMERLKRARDRAWDVITIKTAEAEIESILQSQIRAYDALIAAEEDRKSKDKELIKQWKQEREELFETWQDEKEEFDKTFGGIGEGGYRDAAQGFVDAWKSAFLETGDGLQGLQDHFDEFLNEWFVKQATMRVAGKMLEPLFRDIDDAVDKYSDGGTSVVMDELEKVRERFGIIAPELSEVLEGLAGMWGLGGEGSLSGLAAGIQGMTEEQANILEAYWNSVRGYTASIDANVATIVGILTGRGGRGGEGGISGGIDYNPQLQQMELIAQNTKSINTLLQAVTKSGHSLGGQGIKVFLN